MQLPGLSDQQMQTNNVPFEGYAVRWVGNKDLESQSDYDIISLYVVFIVSTSKILLIFFFYDIYMKLIKFKIHKKNHCWYYIFWAAQILIIVGIGGLIYFASTEQKNKSAIQIFYASLFFDSIIAVVLVVAFSCISYPCFVCDITSDHEKARELKPVQENDKIQAKGQTSLELSTNNQHTCTETSHLITEEHSQMYTEEANSRLESEGITEEQDHENDTQSPESMEETDSVNDHKSYHQRKCLLENNEDDIIHPPLSLCCKMFVKDLCTCSCNSNCCCCTGCACSIERLFTVVMKFTSLFTFLALISYLTQAFPAITISYYLKPTDSLIILGIFELSAVILLLEIALLIFVIERFTWLIYVKEHQKIPREAYDLESGDIDLDTVEVKKTTAYGIDDWVRRDVNKTDFQLKFSYLYSFNNKIRTCHCWAVIMGIQVIAVVFLIAVSAILIYFLIHIVIDQTNANDQFRDIFAVIPTVILNMWLIYKGKLEDLIKDHFQRPQIKPKK